MPAEIPERFLDLFEKQAFAHVATLMADGSPQVTPVWCDLKDGMLRFNSATGRTKDRNVRRDPRVAIEISDPENPYRYLQIRGRVVEITRDGADKHIDELTQKYMGQPSFPYHRAGEKRVTYVVEPEHVSFVET